MGNLKPVFMHTIWTLYMMHGTYNLLVTSTNVYTTLGLHHIHRRNMCTGYDASNIPPYSAHSKIHILNDSLTLTIAPLPVSNVHKSRPGIIAVSTFAPQTPRQIHPRISRPG